MFEARFQDFAESPTTANPPHVLPPCAPRLRICSSTGSLCRLRMNSRASTCRPAKSASPGSPALTDPPHGVVLRQRRPFWLMVATRFRPSAGRSCLLRAGVERHHLARRLAEGASAEGARIAYDPRLHTPPEIDRLTAALARRSIALVALDANPIDRLWTDRPRPPMGAVQAAPARESRCIDGGQARSDARAALKREGVHGLLISDPHASAWLFNMRGADVPHTPLPLCYSFVPLDGAPLLFIEGASLMRRCVMPCPVLPCCTSRRRWMRSSRPASRPNHQDRCRHTRACGFACWSAMPGLGGCGERSDRAPQGEEKCRRDFRRAHGASQGRRSHGPFPRLVRQGSSEGQADRDRCRQGAETFRRETGALKDVSFPSISVPARMPPCRINRVSEASNRAITPGIFLSDSAGNMRMARPISPARLPSVSQRMRCGPFQPVLKG